MDIISSLGGYPYIILFLGMFVVGETVLIPAIFLSFEGFLDPGAVVAVSFVATVLADIAWYSFARFAPLERVVGLKRVSGGKASFERLSALFDQHAYRVLFISKFVYGTRVFVQIIAGLKHLNFRNYVLVNSAGILSYFALLYLVAYVAGKALAEQFVNNSKVAIAGFLLIIVIVHICVQYIARKKWFR